RQPRGWAWRKESLPVSSHADRLRRARDQADARGSASRIVPSIQFLKTAGGSPPLNLYRLEAGYARRNPHAERGTEVSAGLALFQPKSWAVPHQARFPDPSSPPSAPARVTPPAGAHQFWRAILPR